ncbi:MAG TPA: DUF6526 family protein, partial [Chitinophagaceae bacterium]|nr:DUF6526 family protein [Chitinophagaceae bacterium]
HFLTSGLILLGLGGSIVNLIKADPHTHYSAALLVIAFIIMIFLFWFARAFALRAQDRAIRAEENFRHYILTGNPLPKEIRMGQVIALRFASDEEFPELTKRAVEEKLSQKEIKQAVKNWRTDYNRA